MMASIRAAIGLLLMFTLLLGLVYPLGVTAFSEMLFLYKAKGSLIAKDGKVIGSELLGQNFTEDKYFWGRLSATTPPYNAASSSGSNMNPGNPKLLEAAKARIDALHKSDPGNKALVPVDLVTASASGLDPDISVAAAEYQAGRIAKARHMKEEDVLTLIAQFAKKRSMGVLGEPHVNVLRLNLALDQQEMPAH